MIKRHARSSASRASTATPSAAPSTPAQACLTGTPCRSWKRNFRSSCWAGSCAAGAPGPSPQCVSSRCRSTFYRPCRIGLMCSHVSSWSSAPHSTTGAPPSAWSSGSFALVQTGCPPPLQGSPLPALFLGATCRWDGDDAHAHGKWRFR